MTLLLADISDHTLRLLPRAAGAYILAIAVRQPVTLTQRQFAHQCLVPGIYFYCGSARGPGGIAARVKRHCATSKKPHWHVDALTTLPTGQVTACLTIEGGDECRLRAQLCDDFGLIASIAGFGSSDCRDCPAHLLAVAGGEGTALAMLKVLQTSLDQTLSDRQGLPV
ncbi:GIY-YIG nuclease family protein [Thalassospira marina]|uniref:Endonuclease III n=1 Tax=Thalassospira marina TaxID=2048283 RepID=A0A2N3KZJ9_9PROT|nr:GIY-YIG nuclease family protein [Thalassospira marina]PKR55886.1 hypothetical protein COO20_01315 [Thalassospira marina]